MKSGHELHSVSLCLMLGIALVGGMVEGTGAQTCDLSTPGRTFVETDDGIRNFPSKTEVISRVVCQGHYCDNLWLTTRNLPPTVINTAGPHIILMPRISSNTNPNFATCGNGFVQAITCSGHYCDTIELMCRAAFPTVSNCAWAGPISDEFPNNYVDGRTFDQEKFVVGVSCEGKHCDNMFLALRDNLWVVASL